MKRTFFLIGLFMILLPSLVMSCGSKTAKAEKPETATSSLSEETTNDSIGIMTAFERLKSDPIFWEGLGLDGDEEFTWQAFPQKIIQGDLNADGKPDALVSFGIEGRGGGNNADQHYAVLLNQDNGWEYVGQLYASIFVGNFFLTIEKIENGIIKGFWEGQNGETPVSFAEDYILKNGNLITTYTALHRTEEEDREYLFIMNLLTADNTEIPMTGNLMEYEQILGKGKITNPKEESECGTYFKEAPVRYLEFPDLKFELNPKNEAVLISLAVKNGIKIQTGNGTLSETTTLKELKSLFYKEDSWMILNEGNEEKTFLIPDEPESDNHWKLVFDKNGKLVRLLLFISC